MNDEKLISKIFFEIQKDPSNYRAYEDVFSLCRSIEKEDFNLAHDSKVDTPTTTTTVKAGDIVKITSNATYYSGKTIPTWVKAKNWVVREVSGDRAVIDKSEDGRNAICSPINTKYLIVVKTASTAAWTPTVGDIVTFNGNTHYSSSNSAKAVACKGGKAKITQIYVKGKHPYHLVRVSGGGATVYGWVDKGTFTKA